MAFDPQHEFFLRLSDGTPLRVRSLKPADRDFVAESFRRLSPESRYFRFWTRVRELNPRLVEQICTPDQQDHAGWVALHDLSTDIPGVGGASFWRLQDDPQAAEVSFTVADEYQGQGVGTILLAVLWEHARTLGITRFVGHVLHENVAMRTWWDSLGAVEIEASRHWQTILQLDEDLLQPSTAGNSLRARLAELRSQPFAEIERKD